MAHKKSKKPKRSSVGPAPKRPPGRPREAVPEAFAAQILDWIASGKTLRAWCRQGRGRPSFHAVYAWMEKDPEFARRFARAREVGFDLIAEEALEIADTPQVGQIETEVIDGDDSYTKVVREDMLGHRRLQFEARIKLLAVWSPKHRPGMKVQHDVGESFDAALQRALTGEPAAPDGSTGG